MKTYTRLVCLFGTSTLLTLSAPVFADAVTERTIITASTTWANLSSSDVMGSAANPLLTRVNMYYDLTDPMPGSNLWNQDWSLYLSAQSALGGNGPLGYNGPLSSIGPLFNPAYTASWSALPSQYNSLTGTYVWGGQASFGASQPYGASGPLGYSGPLTENALYRLQYHLNENTGNPRDSADDWNDFPHQLDPAGIWGILGPAGPLGALGPLGPLGPRGYGSSGNVTVQSTTGDYQSNGQTVRSLRVAYDPSQPGVERIYDLLELYPRSNLISRQSNPQQFINDSSFSVNSISSTCTLSYASSNDHTYYFKSNYDQWVSIVLTNTNRYAALGFTVSVKADPNNTLASSSNIANWYGSAPATANVMVDSRLQYQPYALMRLKKGEVVRINAGPKYAGNGYDGCGYLLHVVGTGFSVSQNGSTTDSTLFAPRRFGSTTTFNITGPHQQGVAW